MLSPTVGELVRNIADNLRRTVVPALPAGAAQRQLKAALHALGRIEHSWDRLPSYLVSDNADIQESVAAMLIGLEESGIALPPQFRSMRQGTVGLATDQTMQIAGINDLSLAQAAEHNLKLQFVLVEFDRWLRGQAPSAAGDDQLLALERLYSRMVDREMRASATGVSEE